MKERTNKEGKVVALTFETPEEFFAHLDKQCAHCDECGKHEFKNELNEMGIDPITGEAHYVCDDCNEF